MSYEKVILDLESNNLMHPMLDYTQKPLRFNPEFTVWCLSLRCVDTNESKLLVPHPRLHLRKFVLIPLEEIASNYLHPLLNKTIFNLLSECEDTSDVKLFKTQ